MQSVAATSIGFGSKSIFVIKKEVKNIKTGKNMDVVIKSYNRYNPKDLKELNEMRKQWDLCGSKYIGDALTTPIGAIFTCELPDQAIPPAKRILSIANVSLFEPHSKILYINYIQANPYCEYDLYKPGKGVNRIFSHAGRALMGAIARFTEKCGFKKLYLSSSNDDFYDKMGMGYCTINTGFFSGVVRTFSEEKLKKFTANFDIIDLFKKRSSIPATAPGAGAYKPCSPGICRESSPALTC